MGITCDRCHRTFGVTFSFSDARASVERSLAEGNLVIVERRYCRRCMYEANGLYYGTDISPNLPSNFRFNLRTLRGKLAQTIVETVFLHFEWLVYPFGYESYFTNIIRGIVAAEDEAPFHQLRTMPDLLVFRPPEGPGALLEIKGTRKSGASFWLDGNTLKKYLKHWKVAKLVVFSIPDFEIHVVPFERLEGEQLPPAPIPRNLFEVDLAKFGDSIPKHFGFDQDSYAAVMNHIAKETRHFLGGWYGLDQ